MPTFDALPRFLDDYSRLSPVQRALFREARKRFFEDLLRGSFRKGLRVKRLRSSTDHWEMTWAPNGRAIFEYGPTQRLGHKHIIWRRIGTHDILREP